MSPYRLCKASQEVRACCFSFILRVISLDLALIESVARELLDQEQVRASRKTRYFADSHMHRIKHRSVQALLLMEASLSQVGAKL